MLSFWSKKSKTLFFKANSSLTKFSTISLCACEQCGALDWKTLRFFTIFLKNHIFWKLTKDFENRTKRQAETKECVYLDVDWLGYIPVQSKFSHFPTGNPPIPHTSGFSAKIWNFNEEKKYSEDVIKNLYWWFKRTEYFEIIGLVVFVYTAARRNALTFSQLQAMVLLGHLTFVSLCRIHFWSDCNEISDAFEPFKDQLPILIINFHI